MTLRRGELALRYVCYGSHRCHAYALGNSGGLARRAIAQQNPSPRPCKWSSFLSCPWPPSLNQFFGEVTAMQLKRDRVRAHVWGRVTARFNAIAENCSGVWKL